MTRKKLVKQLMARGVGRNNAERFARSCRLHKAPYNEGLSLWDHINGIVYEAFAERMKRQLSWRGGRP